MGVLGLLGLAPEDCRSEQDAELRSCRAAPRSCVVLLPRAPSLRARGPPFTGSLSLSFTPPSPYRLWKHRSRPSSRTVGARRREGRCMIGVSVSVEGLEDEGAADVASPGDVDDGLD
jgi:hypothetical protein